MTRCGNFSPFGRIFEALGEFFSTKFADKYGEFLGNFDVDIFDFDVDIFDFDVNIFIFHLGFDVAILEVLGSLIFLATFSLNWVIFFLNHLVTLGLSVCKYT